MRKIIGIIADFVQDDNVTFLKSPFYRIREHYLAAISSFVLDDHLVIMIPHIHDKIDNYIDLCDGILLVGGDDIPPSFYNEKELFDNLKTNRKRFEFEILFIQKFIKTNKPLLGICAGMQAINVALGGSLYQDIESQVINPIDHKQPANFHQSFHPIDIKDNTKLFDIIKTKSIGVNSIHHQAVKELGSNLIVSANSSDSIIEAIELTNHRFCLGVQWHAELNSNETDKEIFKSFVQSITIAI